MLRATKQQQQAARAQQETALRDVARRAATAVAEDVATTIVNKTSTTKCSEEDVARWAIIGWRLSLALVEVTSACARKSHDRGCLGFCNSY